MRQYKIKYRNTGMMNVKIWVTFAVLLLIYSQNSSPRSFASALTGPSLVGAKP